MPSLIKIKIGTVFNRWTVTGETIRKNKKKFVFCQCRCGKTRFVAYGDMKNGKSRSCGCLTGEIGAANRRKGARYLNKKFKREYQIWIGMKTRCYWSKSLHFVRYGGRGIKVCDRWLSSFDNFISDMGRCPDGFSIDRINFDGNYEPSNCRWANAKTQSNNRSTNCVIIYNGIKRTLSQISEQFNVPGLRVKRRLESGWSFEDAVSVPSLRDKNANLRPQ